MKRASPVRNDPAHKEFMAQYYYTKSSANVRELSFKLSKDQARGLHKGKCVYCGKKPSQGRHYKFNGIDRLDNTKGYTVQNCVSCCRPCNRAKNSITYGMAVKFVQLYKLRFKR